MIDPELPMPETAFDLDDDDRTRVFNALTRTLKGRGRLIGPDPNKAYRDVHGRFYALKPYREARVTKEKLSASGLPYDSVVVTDRDPSEGSDSPFVPDVISLVITGATTQLMPGRDGLETILGFGNFENWVMLKSDQHLGAMVLEVEGGVSLQSVDPFDKSTTSFEDVALPQTSYEILDIITVLEELDHTQQS